jgi:hypothetical protein
MPSFAFSFSRLAIGAEMRRAAAEHDAADGLFAGGAGLVGAIVDAVELLESAFAAFGVDVIAQGAAFVLDCATQDLLDGCVKSS